MQQGDRRSAVLWVLGLVVAIGGVLTWNFKRMEEFRPFRAYSDEQLEALGPAYGEQFAERENHYQELAQARPEVKSGAALGDNLRQFDRVQAISERTRKAGHEVSFIMTAKRDLQREIWIRENWWQHVLGTATRF
jgi:hypothetical protein